MVKLHTSQVCRLFGLAIALGSHWHKVQIQNTTITRPTSTYHSTRCSSLMAAVNARTGAQKNLAKLNATYQKTAHEVESLEKKVARKTIEFNLLTLDQQQDFYAAHIYPLKQNIKELDDKLKDLEEEIDATNDTLTTSLAQIETINKRAADTKQIEDEAMCKKIKREQDVLADMQANRRAKKIKTKTST